MTDLQSNQLAVTTATTGKNAIASIDIEQGTMLLQPAPGLGGSSPIFPSGDTSVQDSVAIGSTTTTVKSVGSQFTAAMVNIGYVQIVGAGTAPITGFVSASQVSVGPGLSTPAVGAAMTILLSNQFDIFRARSWQYPAGSTVPALLARLSYLNERGEMRVIASQVNSVGARFKQASQATAAGGSNPQTADLAQFVDINNNPLAVASPNGELRVANVLAASPNVAGTRQWPATYLGAGRFADATATFAGPVNTSNVSGGICTCITDGSASSLWPSAALVNQNVGVVKSDGTYRGTATISSFDSGTGHLKLSSTNNTITTAPVNTDYWIIVETAPISPDSVAGSPAGFPGDIIIGDHGIWIADGVPGTYSNTAPVAVAATSDWRYVPNISGIIGTLIYSGAGAPTPEFS